MPLGFEVTRYEVIVESPSDVGAVKATVAVVLPVAVAVPIVGASGAATAGTTATEGLEAIDVPTELVAVTVKV